MSLIVAIFCFEAVASAILRGPSNVAVVAGNNMTMACEPTPGTNSLDWYYTPVGSKDVRPINYGSTILRNFSAFSVEGKIPGGLLGLKTTKLKHAGFYQCTSTGQKASAQLVVLGSEPQCNFNSRGTKEGTLVNLFCSVSYNGNWAPVMQWSQVDLENFIFQATPVNVDAIDPLGNELTSNLSFKVNSSTRSHRYSCKTYFKNSSSTQASRTASNTPEYESLWMSPDAKMFYGPENVTVFPIKYVFNPGDILMCSTYSTLNPEFQWTEIQTGDVLKGSEIVINASMVRDEPYIFSCTATNKLTGAFVKSSLLTFAVKDKPVEDISPVTTDHEHTEHDSAGERRLELVFIISAAAIVALVSIAIAACIIVFRKMRQRKRALKRERKSPQTVIRLSSTAEVTSTTNAIVALSLSEHNSVDVQPISLGAAVSGSYEEIDTESDGTPSSCYNVRNVSEEHPPNDEDFGCSEQNSSNSSAGSKQTVKLTRYEGLLERDPVKPSVYLRMLQSNREQETQTSNSQTSSEDVTQSQTVYVNTRDGSSDLGVKA